jgi:hypothetical protein
MKMCQQRCWCREICFLKSFAVQGEFGKIIGSARVNYVS